MTRLAQADGEHLQKQLAYRLAISLVLLSVVFIATRIIFYEPHFLAGGDKIWRLGIDVSIPASSGPVELVVYPPLDTKHIRKIERKILHPNIRIRSNSKDDKSQRTVYAVTSGRGEKKLSLEYVLHQSKSDQAAKQPAVKTLDTTNRQQYLMNNDELQINSYMVKQNVSDLLSRELTQPQLLEEIYKRVTKIASAGKQDELNVPLVLAKTHATSLDKIMVMVALSRAAGIPARIVAGIILKEDIEPELHYWVEIYHDDKWQPYDLKFGYRQSLPDNFLPLRRDHYEIVQVIKGSLDKIDFDIEQEFNHPYLKQAGKSGIFTIFDLTRLSLDTRNELAILLLLPLGALITVLFRHLVGIHSYGVFSPTLLALAVVYNDVITTGITFLVVCLLAVAGRSLFPATITRTPRLAIIFTLVAILLVFSVSVMEQFELSEAGKIILLPVIILTSLVDNFYRAAEERGIPIAVRRLAWTIIIALICIPVIQFESLGELILRYPEIHFVTLAVFMLISAYKGMHLVNLPFFALLKEPELRNRRKRDREKEDSD